MVICMTAIFEFFRLNGFVLEMLLSFALFTWWLERRNGFWYRATACCAGILGASVVWNLVFEENPWSLSARYVLVFILCVIALRRCFVLTGDRALFYATAAGAAQHFAFKLSLVCSMTAGELWNLSASAGMFLYAALVGIVSVVIYLVFARWLRKAGVDRLKYSTVTFSLVGMLLFVNVFQNLFDWYAQGISLPLYFLFESFDLVCCLFVLWLQCEIGGRESLQRQNDILQHLLHQQKQQMETSKETIDLINIKCHDLKKQLGLLRGNVTREELEELRERLSIYDASFRTGNEALDVLLAEKLLVCQSKGIHITCMADGAKLSFLSPAHIYSLFGNALDNAVEAAGQVEDPDKRCIRVDIRAERGMLLAHFENYYQGERSFQDGLPVTTKEDPRFHGFGMKSMRMITEKYGGVLSLKAQDQVFYCNILLPLPAQNAVQEAKTTG